jgi:hypothetical protein
MCVCAYAYYLCMCLCAYMCTNARQPTTHALQLSYSISFNFILSNFIENTWRVYDSCTYYYITSLLLYTLISLHFTHTSSSYFIFPFLHTHSSLYFISLSPLYTLSSYISIFTLHISFFHFTSFFLTLRLYLPFYLHISFYSLTLHSSFFTL